MTKADATDLARAPFARVTEAMKSSAGVLRAAGERIATGNTELADCTKKLMQDNADQLVQVIGDITKAKTPVEGAKIYTDFLMASMQRNAAQLLNMGQMFARSTAETWTSVDDNVASIATGRNAAPGK